MRVPRTAATLQLVSETGCPTRNQKKIFPHQHPKVAWPLVLLDVSPPRTGRALTHSSVAWPRLVVKENTLCGLVVVRYMHTQVTAGQLDVTTTKACAASNHI